MTERKRMRVTTPRGLRHDRSEPGLRGALDEARGELATHLTRQRSTVVRVRSLGLRRERMRKRWHDDMAYQMSHPANAKWITDSLAELDRWRDRERSARVAERGQDHAGRP